MGYDEGSLLAKKELNFRPVVSIQYRLVADRRMDGHTHPFNDPFPGLPR